MSIGNVELMHECFPKHSQEWNKTEKPKIIIIKILAHQPMYTGYVVPSFVVPGYVVPGYVVPGYVVRGYVVPSYVVPGYVVP